jgi:hypothetical protein
VYDVTAADTAYGYFELYSYLYNRELDQYTLLQNVLVIANIVRLTETVDGVAALATPLPAALPLFASGLLALGVLGWRRRWRRASAQASPDMSERQVCRHGLQQDGAGILR